MPSNILSTVDEKQSTVPTKLARSEYRAIVDHEDYRDLCAQNGNNKETHGITEMMPHYTKPPKVRYTTSVPWNASLESIIEEEEEALAERKRQEDSSSSESTYATYINNVNESPRIYHAGRVWCITKSIKRDLTPSEQTQQHLGYLETDIDEVVEEENFVPNQTFHRYKFDDAVLLENREMEVQNPVLAVMPTPTYLLQGTAIPAAYPGHSQYLDITDENNEDVNDNDGGGHDDDDDDDDDGRDGVSNRTDRPNFITTESGHAERTYSFPIANDTFAAALDQNQKTQPCESTVTYSNVNVIPSIIASDPGTSYKQPSEEELDGLMKPPLINIQDALDNVKNIDNTDVDSHDISDNNPDLSSTDNKGWVQTFSSTIIIPAPDISPTIHREDFPDEVHEIQNTVTANEFQQTLPTNEGYLETDIDSVVMPFAEKEENTKGLLEEIVEEIDESQVNASTTEDKPKYPDVIFQESKLEDIDKKVEDKDKTKGHKGNRFMDKFRRSDSLDSKDKPKKKKVKKSKRRKGKKNERDPFDIDDDEDFTTIHDSDEEEEEEGDDDDDDEDQERCDETVITEKTSPEMVMTDVAIESTINPSHAITTERQPPQITSKDHQTPQSSNLSDESSKSKRPERSSMRLLCCQAPRMRPSSADSVKSGPYLVPSELNKRQSNVTEVTELIGNSSEDDDHVTNPAFINGIELEPGQLNIDDIVEEQIDPVSKATSKQQFFSIRPHSDAYMEDSPISSARDEIEFNIPIASSEDDGFDEDELNINTELNTNGNIITPKGYAGENTHAFYIIGIPGNASSGSDVTQQTQSNPNQATRSNDMCTEDKQIHSSLDKETVILEQSSIYNHKPTHNNQSALNVSSALENENNTVSSTLALRSINDEETQPDSLEIIEDAKQERSDRVQELLSEFRQDVTQEPDCKQERDLVTEREEYKSSQPVEKVVTVAKLDPIVTKQPDTFKTRQVQTPDSETFDRNSVHSDASERASLIIAEQRARIRESLSKLNLPDWYKRSKHHRRVINGEIQVDYPDYASEPAFMSCSPTAGGSDWSMDSTGTGSSAGAATKLSFLSEARYRRAYHNYDRYYKSFSSEKPIRSAFSCAEIPRGSHPYYNQDQSRNLEPDGDKYHSSDALLSVDDEPHVEKKSTSILQSSPHHTSTPNLSPSRIRSRSMGEASTNISTDCNLSALSIRRLERPKTNDAVFYITGQIDNGASQSMHELVSPGDDSGFNDSYEPPKESRYEIKEAYIRPTDLPLQKESPSPSSQYQPDQRVNHSYHSYHSPPSKPPRIREQNKTYSMSNNIYHDDTKQPDEPNNYQFVPITRAQDEVTQTFQSNLSHAPLNVGQKTTPTIRPDPRYRPDGSRNDKISPFPMVVPSKNEPVSTTSPAGSPSRRPKCNVQITITDTSLDDDDSIPTANLPHDTLHEPISRPKSPIDFDELRESNFAAVLSVVTSSKSKDTLGDQSSKFRPPPEVSMEEIVDSLLGLSSTSRSPSRTDLQDADTFAKTSRQGSVPDINWSALSEQSQQVNTHNRSASLDSLFSDEGLSPLNSIIIKHEEDGDELSGSSKESTPRVPLDAVGDEIVMVKCSFRKCAKVKELEEARKTYKTCHNCYTYYCSRECRLAHWEKHKKKCLYSRINSAAKHVIYNSRYNEELQNDLSKIARTGYLSRGRGVILLIFPDVESAESYMTFGIEGLPFPPTYSTIKDLEKSGLFGDHLSFLLEMCRTYDPDVKFVLNVAIMATDEEESSSKTLPRKQTQSVKKCAKVRLSMMHTQSRQLPSKERETLILTAPSGVSSEGILDKKSRQICFIHIQRQLRQRGVSLRHQHSDVYDQLCRWVEYHDHFTPVTIYPREGGTGPRFMCVLMPDSDPNDFGWVDNPKLLDSIDLDAELEKLEDVVSSATATKL